MARKGGASTTESKKKSVKESVHSVVMPYQLSDPMFITLKWTKLPPIQKTHSFNLPRPWSCFKKRETCKYLYYPKGQLAAKFNTDGTGKILYFSGTTAIELKQTVCGYQYISLYSEKLSSGEIKRLGWLDFFGNCIICDLNSNIIANYTQQDGVIFQKDGFWKWRWEQLVVKRGMSSPNNYFAKKLKPLRELSPDKTTSEILLDLYVKVSPNKRALKLGEGKIYFQCKVSDSISLWISSQEKIDLSFASNSFITRLDVGVSLQTSKPEDSSFFTHKRRSTNLNMKNHSKVSKNFNDEKSSTKPL